MASQASKIRELLYVSDDQDGAVFVYDYRTGKLVGELTGFNSPYGQCVDKNGNVFLTTEIGSTGAVLKYAHGASQPIKTFATSGHPIGCSVAPKSGNLAVAVGLPGNNVAIEVWKHARGSPKQYSNYADCPGMWPPGYDDAGNLFVETGDDATVCELPSNGSGLIRVDFDHSLTSPGSVMWDGRYITFTDLDASGYNTTTIYRAKQMSSGTLTVVGTTVLQYKGCGVIVIQPFIVGKKNTPANTQEGNAVVGGNLACYNTKIQFWHYKRGGEAFRHIRRSPQDVVGQSVSIAE